MQEPNIVVVIDKNSIMKHLNSKISEALNVAPGVVITNPTLTFKEEGIDVSLGVNANVGSVSVGGTAEGTVLATIAGSSLHFLPALSKIAIVRLDIGGQPINPTIVSIVNAGLVDVISRINAGLQQAISPIPLTINPFGPLDVAAQLRAVPGVVSANAKPFSLGVSLDGALQRSGNLRTRLHQ